MNNDLTPIKGVLTIREFSKETGELLYEYSDENVITTLGMNTLFLRSVLPDVNETMILKNFFIGIDTGLEEDPSGGWTQFNPRPARKDYSSLNQYVVYEVEAPDMVFDYPAQNQFQAGTLLDGEYILNTLYPDEPDIRYTSATLRFENDTTFSYKRFPVRSLSRLIDVQIVWSFTFENATDYVCPIPDSASELFTYTQTSDGSLLRYLPSLTEQNTNLSVNDFTVLPNGDVVALTSGTNVTVYNEALVQLSSFSVLSSSMIDAHPNGDVIVAGGSRVVMYRGASHLWTSTMASAINSIWMIDQNRILVSMDNDVAMIASATGTLTYLSSFDGAPTAFSSIGGEVFVGQNIPNALIKTAFDLSEISRNPLTDSPDGYVALHDNDIGYSSGTNVVRTNADLGMLWNRNLNRGTIQHMSSDRERNIYAFTSGEMLLLDESMQVVNSRSISNVEKVASVGGRWGMTNGDDK